jgi:hypothetical protein
MHLTHDELSRRFNYHQPNTQEKVDRHKRVREACLFAANELTKASGPESREQSLAITHIEEAMFWANAAIAREITGDA